MICITCNYIITKNIIYISYELLWTVMINSTTKNLRKLYFINLNMSYDSCCVKLITCIRHVTWNTTISSQERRQSCICVFRASIFASFYNLSIVDTLFIKWEAASDRLHEVINTFKMFKWLLVWPTKPLKDLNLFLV
jgi:hypothetical protein